MLVVRRLLSPAFNVLLAARGMATRTLNTNVRLSEINGTMAKSKQRIPEELQRWIDARRRFHLSHAQVQMARELGMNPRKLGALANRNQEPWKAPLPVFIEHLYRKASAKLSQIASFPSRTEREKLPQRRPRDVNVGKWLKFPTTWRRSSRNSVGFVPAGIIQIKFLY